MQVKRFGLSKRKLTSSLVARYCNRSDLLFTIREELACSKIVWKEEPGDKCEAACGDAFDDEEQLPWCNTAFDLRKAVCQSATISIGCGCTRNEAGND